MRTIGCIVSLGAIALLLSAVPAAANQYGRHKDPRFVEYSNDKDEKASFGGGNHNGVDPGQSLITEPPDAAGAPNPRDGIDFYPGIESGAGPEVDALASYWEYLFDDLVANRAELLYSLAGDPGDTAVYVHSVLGVTEPRYFKSDFNNPNGAGALDDIDGLEVFGPTGTADANYFSLKTDSDTSVYRYPLPGGPPALYILRSTIFNAVSSLGFNGTASQVDLDALMVKDQSPVGTWGTGDAIVFSIRAAANFHGGEIIYLQFPNVASYLNQGGVVWDTTHTPGTLAVKEIDAIEADRRGTGEVPGTSRWSVVLLAALLLGGSLVAFAGRREARRTG